MKRTSVRNTLIISAILILAGAGIVWAHDGWGGYGGHMMGYGGGDYGGHMMGPGYGPMMGPGYGSAYSNLSEDQYNKLENAREKFYDQTRDLREKMDEKSYAMQEELNRQNPDQAKLEALQQDLSGLRDQFDKSALDYNLAVRKIAPDAARGPAYAGGYRGGYCW
jgi:zinc resistance-associated protein